MRKVYFLIALGILLMVSLRAGSKRELAWMTFEQAQDLAKAQPKLILMDIYTDWCYWCKVMDHNTYSDPTVAAYLRDKFYPVRFNAESKLPVSWKGQSFEYNPGYRVNDLALSLTQGHLAYPTTVIITPDGHNPVYVQGFLKPSDMEPVLKYFGEGAYKTMSYPQFKKTFQAAWK